jgi:hypothetical protein
LQAAVVGFAKFAQQHEVQKGVDVIVVEDALYRIRAGCLVKIRKDNGAGQELLRVERQTLPGEVALEEGHQRI